MKQKTIRIIALALAGLIFLGVFAGAIIHSFALESAVANFPDLGEKSKLIPILIIVIAIIVAAVCFLIPKMKDKNND